LLAAALALHGAAAQAGRFEFVALGDMPYGPREIAWPPYEALIAQVNQLRPAFTIHVGDFKSGNSPCSDEEFEAQRGFFDRFDSALVYTPGDNEWTDCHRLFAGGFDPLERLAALRRMFFAEPRSPGRTPLPVQRQSDRMPAFAPYRENLRFLHGEVLFVTLHIVGSNNNFEPRDARAVEEFKARDAANIAWIRTAFDEARESQARAIVFAMQADPFESRANGHLFPPQSGFTASIGGALLPLSEAWGRPVLLIHGDSHRFRFDRPFANSRGDVIRNLARLEVYGAPDVHAVRVRVDTDAASPFDVTPVLNRLSPRSRRDGG
jgi:hypothetical protein